MNERRPPPNLDADEALEADKLYTDEYLNQDELWVNRYGWVRVADMNVEHRRNAAMFLLRKAPQLALTALMWREDEPSVRETMAMVGSPTTWMKTRPLYQRIIQDGADPDGWEYEK